MTKDIGNSGQHFLYKLSINPFFLSPVACLLSNGSFGECSDIVVKQQSSNIYGVNSFTFVDSMKIGKISFMPWRYGKRFISIISLFSDSVQLLLAG